MNQSLEQAIRYGVDAMRDQELCWKTVAVRYGVDLARETRAQLKEAGALPLPDEPNPLRKALEVCIEVEAFREWAKTGFLLVSLSRADALVSATVVCMVISLMRFHSRYGTNA